MRRVPRANTVHPHAPSVQARMMPGISGGRKLLALGGFVMLGLSPSFLDWEQTPAKRMQIVAFYALAIAMFWFGLLK